jgi:hypothetical protein
MAADQVRQASKLLGPLLRRRGTSPALGATLRKALSALDKSLTGLDAQGQEAVIAAAIADLRACVGLIAASDRPADHEQLGGIEAALALLAPAEPAAGAALSLLSQLPVLPAAPTAKGRTPRRQRKAPRVPIKAADTVDTQLVQLAARMQFLHAVLHEPLVREADVAAVRAEVDTIIIEPAEQRLSLVLAGEAGAMLVLTNRPDKEALATWLSAAAGNEEACRGSDRPITGAGLEEAMSKALALAKVPFAAVACLAPDFSGEARYFEELVLANARLAKVSADRAVEIPAFSVGESGAAAGFLAIAMLAFLHSKGVHAQPSLAVLSCDGPGRGAVVLGPANGEGR